MMAEPGRAACMCAEDSEYLPTERIGLIVYHLCEGEIFTVAQVAEMAGITYQGARQMLNRLSRTIPILCLDGEWMMQALAELKCLDGFPKEDELPP